ncbi:hypothetical protein FRB94_007862 [Tulasnella sp. JGI-2019a]|nr:hypothetical protein FRB94_007862 [Tulasnella sp. JGI-2019a]
MWSLVLSVLALTSSISSTPIGTSTPVPDRYEYTSEVHGASIRYVNNSGICETTPGVHTMSGYLDIGTNQSIWFWFFAAREVPETAPFLLWLNGGPGCSSMIGLFQENGPCTVTSDNQTQINPYSWNNLTNLLYIDQPVGAGFSYGQDTINSTEAAAVPMWTALQIFFEQFPTYQSREFILATESYGGHYGPAFVTYFNQQNTLVSAGQLKAENITVSALMINNGWYDPLLQNKAYVDYATYAPGYGPIADADVLRQVNDSFYKPGGCRDQEIACYAADLGNVSSSTSNEICLNADNYCTNEVFNPAIGSLDPYDIRQRYPDPYPSELYINFLTEPTIQKAIGAEVVYQECPDAPYDLFVKTGDDARTWLPELGALANSKLKMLIWAGDADFNCNWLGAQASVLGMDWYGNATLRATPLTNITINGEVVAAVQNVDNFSFARVYHAGHEVSYYQPQVAFELLKQVIANEPLHSVTV